MVDDRGQVAVRGDIVDVFPSTGQTPVRIELFGDEVERISTYSLFTQRSLEPLHHTVLYPAAERLLRDPDLEAWERDDEGRQPVPSGLVPLIDELADMAALATWEPVPGRGRRARASRGGQRAPRAPRAAQAYARAADISALIERSARLDPLASAPTRLEGQRPALAGRGLSESENELRGLVGAGMRVVVAFPHRGDAERALLGLRRVEARVLDAEERLPPARHLLLRLARAPRVRVDAARARAVARRAGLPSACAADDGAAPRSRARELRGSAPGDHVVHEDHGVGKFLRFDVKTVAGVTRDYVELAFRGEDKLFVPHDQLGKVTRYVGADARAPALSKLGGKAWQTLKTRARVAVHELAGELLALYAQRQTRTRESHIGDEGWIAPHASGIIGKGERDFVRILRSRYQWIGREKLQSMGREIDKASHATDSSRRSFWTHGHSEAKSLKIIYTPLHGTGSVIIKPMLKRLGFNFELVPEQDHLMDDSLCEITKSGECRSVINGNQNCGERTCRCRGRDRSRLRPGRARRLAQAMENEVAYGESNRVTDCLVPNQDALREGRAE